MRTCCASASSRCCWKARPAWNMAGATDPIALLQKWRAGLSKDDRWCILINADPDALASALALKRIMIHKVHSVDIARINEVTRPDNLAMPPSSAPATILRRSFRKWLPVSASSAWCRWKTPFREPWA